MALMVGNANADLALSVNGAVNDMSTQVIVGLGSEEEVDNVDNFKAPNSHSSVVCNPGTTYPENPARLL